AAEPYCHMVDPQRVPPPVRGASPRVEAQQHPLTRVLHHQIDVLDFLPGLSDRAVLMDDKTIARIRAIYIGQAMEADHPLGRVFAALKQSGRWDNTAILFMADHGEQLFDHYMLGKAGYFDQSAHIPLIIRDPRVQADAGRGRLVSEFTEAVDIMPTVLA